jgi:metal transporter CNNM
MSGLTMGLLSLDIMSLEVLKRGGKPHQQVLQHSSKKDPLKLSIKTLRLYHLSLPLSRQRYSTRILQLVKRHHLLLVTLLLANAVAVEAMPIFLSKITSEVVAVIVSVTAILIFGE